MSHFAVLVIGPDPEALLRPFQENNMGDCPEEYMVFYNEETEEAAKYQSGSTEMVRCPDGTYATPYDDRFKETPRDKAHGRFNAIDTGVASILGGEPPKFTYPDGHELVTVPFTELFPTFEQYMAEYIGYRQRDPRTGFYGYWENPNAKWDYYRLGGRWLGFWTVKPEAVGDSRIVKADVPWEFGGGPMPSVNSDGPGERVGLLRADAAPKRLIDFDSMRDEQRTGAEQQWDKWSAVLEKYGGEQGYRDASDGRLLDRGEHAYFDFGVEFCRDGDRYQSRDEYMRNQAAIGTFAVLKDGEWYERGEMGWWAAVANEKDGGEWSNIWDRLVDEASDDEMLWVYDCHI